MGTNFYWITDETDVDGEAFDHMDPYIHIGKRSAAGYYCWGCRVTLCRGGESRIHWGDEFFDACPTCGAPKTRDDIAESSAGVELGFAKPREFTPLGVHTVSSFRWAQEADSVRQRCDRSIDSACIVDEYGRTMTGGEFIEMLRHNCPVQFHDSVGTWFC